jgi:hypothetical protein
LPVGDSALAGTGGFGGIDDLERTAIENLRFQSARGDILAIRPSGLSKGVHRTDQRQQSNDCEDRHHGMLPQQSCHGCFPFDRKRYYPRRMMVIRLYMPRDHS